VNRRGFIALASGLLVPEVRRVYSFGGLDTGQQQSVWVFTGALGFQFGERTFYSMPGHHPPMIRTYRFFTSEVAEVRIEKP
jgi:hypothetical protein